MASVKNLIEQFPHCSARSDLHLFFNEVFLKSCDELSHGDFGIITKICHSLKHTIKIILFLDEAHFHLLGTVVKQKMFSPNLTVLCAVFYSDVLCS